MRGLFDLSYKRYIYITVNLSASKYVVDLQSDSRARQPPRWPAYTGNWYDHTNADVRDMHASPYPRFRTYLHASRSCTGRHVWFTQTREDAPTKIYLPTRHWCIAKAYCILRFIHYIHLILYIHLAGILYIFYIFSKGSW